MPGRGAIRRRLEELLQIGAVGAPTPARGRYFYLRRDGTQNQPVLYVRDGVDGPDRVAVDVNALDAEGTTALDWYFPSHDGRYLAYGLSSNGSEESTLHLLDVASGQLLSDRISGTRAASLAWLPDASAFYYTRYPAPGQVPEGEHQYHRAVYFHRVGDDPTADPLVFKPAEKEHWPGVDLSPDGRWLVLQVARTFDQTDLFLRDCAAKGPFVAVAKDLPASSTVTSSTTACTSAPISMRRTTGWSWHRRPPPGGNSGRETGPRPRRGGPGRRHGARPAPGPQLPRTGLQPPEAGGPGGEAAPGDRPAHARERLRLGR